MVRKRSYLEQQTGGRRQRKHVAFDPPGQSPETSRLGLTSTLFGKKGREAVARGEEITV